MIIDNTLPVAADDNGDDVNIVKWYSHQSKKYLAVHKMPISVLSIFHGPKLESIFSAMGEVIDKKANRMCHPTYSAIQTEALYADSMPKFQLFPKHPAL